MKNLLYILAFLSVLFANAQTEAFKAMVDSTLDMSVPFISVSELKNNYKDYIILDAREEKEFKVSHLKDAKLVGYNNVNLNKTTKGLSLETPIVVYCSIGYRSEKIAKKLMQKGYTVYNLYGGIFDWKNNNYTVVNSKLEVTEKVHCYNKEWSKWLINGVKIYE